METMFMQVFEHRDWVKAQMRQQVASSSDSLACTLIAAGSRPPAWLLPHPTSAIGAQGNTLRKPSLDLANLKRADVVHLASPTSHQVSEPKPLEFGGFKLGNCNIIGSSETINQRKSCMSETILTKFTSVHPLNEDLSSTISLEASLHEVLHSVSSPLPEKETAHAAEKYSLEGPNSMASPLLKIDSLQSVKPIFLEGIDSMAGPVPEKDMIHTAEIDFLEGPTSGAPEILRSPQNNVLADGRSPHPKKNMLEDGCRHDSHSHVCGAFNTFSLQSAANLEKLLPKYANDEHLYQNNTLFPGTTNHNDSCSARASDASISARTEPFQMQTSLPNLSPELDRTATTGDTHIESSSLSTSNKSLQIEAVLDSVSCQQSGHAESQILVQSEAYDVSVRNNMDECVTPEVTGGTSSEGAQILQTSERNSTTSAKECLGSLWHEELNARSSTTGYDKQIQSSQTSTQHLPRSSGSGKMVASFKSDVQSTVSHWKRSIADGVQTQVNSSCERVVMNCQSSSNVSPVPQHSQSHYLENGPDKVSNSSPNYSNTLSDGDACCTSKKKSCFPNPDTDVKVVTIEDKIFTGIDFVACRSGVFNTENYPITTSPTTVPKYALYQKNQHASLESITKSSTVKGRAFVGLCESEKLIELSCNLSRKYKMGSKMEPLCGKYESLAARFEKLVNRCSVDSVDTKWHDPSYIKNLGVPGKYSLEFNDSLLMPNVLTYDSVNANSAQEVTGIPLTPSVQKYSLEKLYRRTGSNSECMGSIAEFACFQIHEDSNVAEENENEEMLPGCRGTNYSTQEPTDRKPLDHVASSYQSREKKTSSSTRHVDVGRPVLITPKAYSMDPDRHLHNRTDQAMKNPKENRASSIRKGKASQPLRDRETRVKLLNRKNARDRSEANLAKGWKPFVPLVKQNQQFRTSVKENIRVKAFEAAEAANRRQEKKQNERDTSKAAAGLECQRLKQAGEQKQKQVERKNKIDTDVVTRKKQRGDDENKENGRKKKCLEEAQIPEQQVDRMHATNRKKDGCRKNYDEKEPNKDLVGGLKHELVPGERAESVHRFIASESNDLKVVVADGRSESSTLQVQESFADAVDKSYEMSPCKDSDEEDDDGLEHEEELRRRMKLIPSWSREENLDKILLSNQSLDPAEIFARNGCFVLSDVLALHVPQRLFN